MGTVFNERYYVEKPIGSGGMADVFLARRDDGLSIALKILNNVVGAKAEVQKRFLREAELIAGFQHPNIVRFYDYGHADGLLFIAMEYVEGVPLSDLMENGLIRPEFALEVVRQACAALMVSHNEGIVHRDIKPSNIFLSRSPDGSLLVKLLDFGVAHIEARDVPISDDLDEPETVEALTQIGSVIGTPNYMAPEQARGLPVTQAADIYALGVVLYRAVTGELPFPGASPFAVLVAKLHGAMTPPSQQAPGLPDWVDPLCGAFLQLEPANRPRTAAASDMISAILERPDLPRVPTLPQLPVEDALEYVALIPLEEVRVEPLHEPPGQTPAREKKPSWVVLTDPAVPASPREPAAPPLMEAPSLADESASSTPNGSPADDIEGAPPGMIRTIAIALACLIAFFAVALIALLLA